MPTILDLFEKLKQIDDDLIEFTPEDHKDLLNDTKAKITAYHEVKSRLLCEREMTKERIKLLEDRFNSFEIQIKKLDEYLKMACKACGVTEFPGNGVTLKLISQKRVRPKCPAASWIARDYPMYCSEEIEKHYKWDNSKILADYKAGLSSVKEIAEEYTTEYLRFKL